MLSTPPPLPEESPESANSAMPFQFSMRTMLIATTAFAVWCVAVALVPSAISGILIGLLSYIISTFLIAGIVFGRGDTRAFCIGALLVFLSMWTDLGGQFMHGIHSILRVQSPWSLWTDFVFIGLTAAANGWVSVRARRYFQPDSTD